MSKGTRGGLQMFLNYNYQVLTIIKRVSCTNTTFLRPKLIKLTITENEAEEIADKFLETQIFSVCRGNRWRRILREQNQMKIIWVI